MSSDEDMTAKIHAAVPALSEEATWGPLSSTPTAGGFTLMPIGILLTITIALVE